MADRQRTLLKHHAEIVPNDSGMATDGRQATDCHPDIG